MSCIAQSGDLVVEASGEPERPRRCRCWRAHGVARRRKELFHHCRHVFLQILEGAVGKALACRLVQRGLVKAGLLALTIQSTCFGIACSMVIPERTTRST